MQLRSTPRGRAQAVQAGTGDIEARVHIRRTLLVDLWRCFTEARLTAGWRGRNAAMLTIIGCISSLLVVGMYSTGTTDMRFYVLGLNHKTALIKLRTVFDREDALALTAERVRQIGLEESFVVSTCNRVELYGAGQLLVISQSYLDKFSRMWAKHHSGHCHSSVPAHRVGRSTTCSGSPQALTVWWSANLRSLDSSAPMRHS